MKTPFLPLGIFLLTIAPAWSGSIGINEIGGTQFTDYSLTFFANLDWVIFGQGTNTSLAGSDRRAGGNLISSLTNTSNGNPLLGLGQFGAYGEWTFGWTNGTNVASAHDQAGGLTHDSLGGGHSPVGEGFSFSVPVDSQTRTMHLFYTVRDLNATVSLHFSDNSVSTGNLQVGGGQVGGGGNVVAHDDTITFSSATPGLTLQVALSITGDLADPADAGNGDGQLAVTAISLSGPALSSSVPEPSTFGMIAGVALVGVGFRRRYAG